MSTDLGASFNEQYMNINTKLKKRFMRKPNVTEATQEFIALAIQSEHSDQFSFAGQAYIGAAKCEASCGNFLGEAEYYLAAARQFIKAEKKHKSLKFYSPDRENLEAAIGCFMQAFTKYPERSPIRSAILMEIASNLIDLNLKNEALTYCEQALHNVNEKTLKIMYMHNILNLQIDCGKLDLALETANNIVESSFNIPEHILSEIQVTRLLLSLLVKPAEEVQPNSLKQLFTDIMDDNESQDIPFNTDLRLKLKSIIICCYMSDNQSLINASADASRFLGPQQKDLLDMLIK